MSITIREYHPVSGALLGNMSIMDFGKLTAGTHGRVKVIDIAFDEVTNVGNLKIGLISTGGITPFSGGTGHFGIISSASFDSTLASQAIAPPNYFLGVNTTNTASDVNNVAIPMRTSTISNYIYLDIEIGSTNLAAGNGSFKLFYDWN